MFSSCEVASRVVARSPTEDSCAIRSRPVSVLRRAYRAPGREPSQQQSAPPDVTRSAVLILSKDPVVGALLGAAVELVGFAPTFPEADESAAAAIRRTQSPVALVDAGHGSADAALVARETLSEGARPILFASRESANELAAAAARVGAPSFTVPGDHGQLAKLLHASQ